MKAKFSISDEERQYFEQAMQNVHKLDEDKLPLTSQSQRFRHAIKPEPDPIESIELIVKPENKAPAGLQNRALKRFRTGKMTIDASIDLHGLKLSQAQVKTERFLKESLYLCRKVLLIIHGKGMGSVDAKPVLKNWLCEYLSCQACVIAYAPAPRHLGGSGASLVLLKN